MSRPNRLLLALLLAPLVLLALPLVTAAHTELERAEPSPAAVQPRTPPELRLFMTETIEPSFAQVVVLDPAGQAVPTGRPEVSPDRLVIRLPLPALPDGTYTVSWKATSTVDGHTTLGFFPLAIGIATPAPAVTPAPASTAIGPPVPLQAAIRWLAFTGQAVLVGGLLFWSLILRPALGTAGPGLNGPALAAARRRARLDAVALAALALAALGALLIQVATAANLAADQIPGALSPVLATRYGQVWSGRVLVLALLAVIVWLLRRPATPTWVSWVGVGLGLALLLTTSLISHGAATREAPELAILADWLHLVATTAWVGGLAMLALVVPAAVAATHPEERRRVLDRLVTRFSTLSIVAVALLLLSGGYGSVLHVDRIEALWTTDYGRALLAKVLMLLPMLAVGALNLLCVRPALASAGRTTHRRARDLVAAAERWGRTLGRSVRVEFAIGLAILVATGVLTSLPPARQPAPADGLLLTETVGDLRLALRVTPARPGENTLDLTVTRGGRPVDDASKVLARLTFLDRELGETELVLAPAGGGRYAIQGRELGLVGRWQAEMIVRRDGQDDARTAMRFPIPGGAAAAAGGGMTLRPSGFVALGLLGLAGLLVVVAMRLRRTVLFGALAGAGAGALTLSVYLFATGGLATAASSADGAGNPFAPTAQSLAQGKTVYTANCQACHGVGGKGDGPAGVGLNPPPLDLTIHVGQHPDTELYRMVSQGVRGTAMPPFAGRLSEEERWHLINYIRTLDTYRQAGQSLPSGQP